MTDDFKKAFGRKVKHYRNLLNYSQEELAEKIGVSSNTISYIERGKNSISFSKIPLLCKALQIDPYKLFFGTSMDEENLGTIDRINCLLKSANERQLKIIMKLIENIMDL